MFRSCSNIEELDVFNFNTKNSISFKGMFQGCTKLKKIDVSNFNSSNCTDINYIFERCENISEINMINWNMSKIKNFIEIFYGCRKLKKIKMSCNFNNTRKIIFPFKGLPKEGEFIWKQGINFDKSLDEFLRELPTSWNRHSE